MDGKNYLFYAEMLRAIVILFVSLALVCVSAFLMMLSTFLFIFY